jgi:hypothetical protein
MPKSYPACPWNAKPHSRNFTDRKWGLAGIGSSAYLYLYAEIGGADALVHDHGSGRIGGV